jgi:hypothetical protein
MSPSRQRGSKVVKKLCPESSANCIMVAAMVAPAGSARAFSMGQGLGSRRHAQGMFASFRRSSSPAPPLLGLGKATRRRRERAGPWCSPERRSRAENCGQAPAKPRQPTNPRTSDNGLDWWLAGGAGGLEESGPEKRSAPWWLPPSAPSSPRRTRTRRAGIGVRSITACASASSAKAMGQCRGRCPGLHDFSLRPLDHVAPLIRSSGCSARSSAAPTSWASSERGRDRPPSRRASARAKKTSERSAGASSAWRPLGAFGPK